MKSISENNIENFAIEQLWSLSWQYVSGVSIATGAAEANKTFF